MRIKLSGLPLFVTNPQSGGLGLRPKGLGDAIPQKYPFFFFFRGFAAKKEEKTGLGLRPKAMKPLS